MWTRTVRGLHDPARRPPGEQLSPARRRPAHAAAHVDPDGLFTVRIDASDIGTGAWTVLTQIAADALQVPIERVRLEIGDSALPRANGAGGSMGTVSWGSAILDAAQKLRALLHQYDGVIPPAGLEALGETGQAPGHGRYSMHSFGAQFVEAHVHAVTGEIRVPRMVGIFTVGRVINPKTARSQLLGGMTMGLSMALLEESVMDTRFGDYVNHSLAEYLIAVNADVGQVEVDTLEEEDFQVDPLGAKGLGEIGIVGTAAAVANAVYHAVGVRVRDLPITLDTLMADGASG